MYSLLKDLLLDLLRCPKSPPEPPAGTYDSVHMFRADRAYLRYRLLVLAIGLLSTAVFGGMAVATGVLSLASRMESVLLPALLFALIAALWCLHALFLYVTTRLDYEMRYYIITDRSLRIREGVVNIREITLTFENIQNMTINQGPLQRLFGIYDLTVQTAGGGGAVAQGGGKEKNPASLGGAHQGVFRGVKNPQKLRDLILSCLRQVRSTGLGDADEEDGALAPSPGFGAMEIEALRALRDELAAWRNDVSGRQTAGGA